MDEAERDSAKQSMVFLRILAVGFVIILALSLAFIPGLGREKGIIYNRMLCIGAGTLLSGWIVLRAARLRSMARFFLFNVVGLCGTTAALIVGGVTASSLLIFFALSIIITCTMGNNTLIGIISGASAVLISVAILAGHRFHPDPAIVPELLLAIFALSAALALGLIHSRNERDLRKKLTQSLNDLRAVQTEQERHLNILTETHLLLEERYAETYALFLIEQEIASELDEGVILAKVVDIVVGLLGGRSCSIYLANRDQACLQEVSISGSARATLTFPLSGNPLARCWAENIPLSHLDLTVEERDFWKTRSTNGLLSAPIGTKEERVGLILVEYDRLPQSMEDHQSLLILVAGQLSLALENAALYRKVRQMATHDALTDLWNLHYFKEKLLAEVEKANPERPVSTIILDIDCFKQINDQYGHAAGDEILKSLARLLVEEAPADVTIARYGGDEFVLLLPGLGITGARATAERIRGKVHASIFLYNHHRIKTTISLGIASYPEHIADSHAFLRLADEGLYLAKRAGRNRVEAAC